MEFEAHIKEVTDDSIILRVSPEEVPLIKDALNNGFVEVEITVPNKELLRQFRFDSTAPNFIDIDSLIILLDEIEEILDYAKSAYSFDSLESGILEQLSPYQAKINGIGLLQILYTQQNCIKQLYSLVMEQKLDFPTEIQGIREARNIFGTHPEGRKVIPQFDFTGVTGYCFDESQEDKSNYYFPDLIKTQQKFVSEVLEGLLLAHLGKKE